MGLQRRALEDEDEKHSVVTAIAVETGVVKACSFHEDLLFAGHVDFTYAYKIAASRLKRGDFGNLFESQRELTDLIKEVSEDNSFESRCLRCTELTDRG